MAGVLGSNDKYVTTTNTAELSCLTTELKSQQQRENLRNRDLQGPFGRVRTGQEARGMHRGLMDAGKLESLWLTGGYGPHSVRRSR